MILSLPSCLESQSSSVSENEGFDMVWNRNIRQSSVSASEKIALESCGVFVSSKELFLTSQLYSLVHDIALSRTVKFLFTSECADTKLQIVVLSA